MFDQQILKKQQEKHACHYSASTQFSYQHTTKQIENIALEHFSPQPPTGTCVGSVSQHDS